MRSLSKPRRKVDQKLIASMFFEPCCICGASPSHASHVRSRGCGGPDERWNVLPLCAMHHGEWHAMGQISFAMKYGKFASILARHGWVMDRLVYPDGSNFIDLWHPKLDQAT